MKAILAPASQIYAFKNCPRNILCDENCLYEIVLVDLMQNIVLEKENTFKYPDINFLNITKT